MTMKSATLTLCLTLVLVLVLNFGESRPSDSRVRRNSLDEQMIADAYIYYERMHMQTSCKAPQPRVIPVQQVHPSSTITYVTDCVLLHRCAWDTGCCPPSEVCTVSNGHEERVDIPVMFNRPGEPMGVMLLQFTNHTDCSCVSQKELAKRA